LREASIDSQRILGALLRRMKARRVLRFEEVEIELRLALKVPRAVELFVFRAR
jgi:hypothetical protein